VLYGPRIDGNFLRERCGAAAVGSVSDNAVDGSLLRIDDDFGFGALCAEERVGRVGSPFEVCGLSCREADRIADADAVLVGMEVGFDEIEVDAVPGLASERGYGFDKVGAVVADAGDESVVVLDEGCSATINLIPVEVCVGHIACHRYVGLVAVADDGVAEDMHLWVFLDEDGECCVVVAVGGFRYAVACGVGHEVVGVASDEPYIGRCVECQTCGLSGSNEIGVGSNPAVVCGAHGLVEESYGITLAKIVAVDVYDGGGFLIDAEVNGFLVPAGGIVGRCADSNAVVAGVVERVRSRRTYRAVGKSLRCWVGGIVEVPASLGGIDGFVFARVVWSHTEVAKSDVCFATEDAVDDESRFCVADIDGKVGIYRDGGVHVGCHAAEEGVLVEGLVGVEVRELRDGGIKDRFSCARDKNVVAEVVNAFVESSGAAAVPFVCCCPIRCGDGGHGLGFASGATVGFKAHGLAFAGKVAVAIVTTL